MKGFDRMLRKFLLLVSLLGISFLFAYSFADVSNSPERILLFDSKIIANKDESIDVTEIISVYANHDKIVHGIVRDLQKKVIDSSGASHLVNYTVKDVLINGAKSAYTVRDDNNIFTINIGDVNATIPSGIYSYTIKYHADHAINMVKNQHELNWNVTGNNWDFLIATVQADISLPVAANVSGFTAATGKAGEKRTNFTATQPVKNQIVFTSTQPLMQKEGLIIDVTWTESSTQLKDGTLIKSLLNNK